MSSPVAAALLDLTDAGLSPLGELSLPAILLRGCVLPEDLVSVYVPSAPTVAFTARDLRSPGIERATAIARAHGFAAGTRSPGGKMVAYDSGAVVVDHLAATSASNPSGSALFSAHATHHARVLGSLGSLDTRVGEVPGEYCPGEYSVNVGGVVKVLGSAQRIVRQGSLFSTVIQVELSTAVREVITEVSAALGYELRESSLGGLAEFSPGLTAAEVREVLRDDYRHRLGLIDAAVPRAALCQAQAAADAGQTLPLGERPFPVDDWTRAHPLTAPDGSAQDVAG